MIVRILAGEHGREGGLAFAQADTGTARHPDGAVVIRVLGITGRFVSPS